MTNKELYMTLKYIGPALLAASNATVRFPVEAYLARIRKIAEDVARLELSYHAAGTTSSKSSTHNSSSNSSSKSSASNGGGSSSSSSGAMSPEQALAAVERYMFALPPLPPAAAAATTDASSSSRTVTNQTQHEQQDAASSSTSSGTSSRSRGCGFMLWPAGGRSALPPRTLMDHAGVWEDARAAYLNEVLVRKRGSAAALAIIHQEVGCGAVALGT